MRAARVSETETLKRKNPRSGGYSQPRAVELLQLSRMLTEREVRVNRNRNQTQLSGRIKGMIIGALNLKN